MAEPRPQLLGDVRREWREHQDELFDGAAGRAVGELLGQMAGQFDQRGDGDVVAQAVVILTDLRDCLVQQAKCLVVGLDVGDADGTGLLVDDQAPRTLQESLQSHNVFRCPRARLIEWTHVHLVEPQRICAVLGSDVVGSHRVLQRLAHLAVLLRDLLTVVEELAVDLGDLFRRHIDAA